MYIYSFNINSKSDIKGANIPIKLRYYESRNKRVQIDTGIKISKRHWSDTKKTLKNSAEIPSEVQRFNKLQSLVLRIINYYKDDGKYLSCKKFKDHFETGGIELRHSGDLTLLEELDVFIDEREGEVVSDVIKDYKTLRKHLKSYEQFSEEPLSFDEIDYNFYKAWTNYLAYDYVRRDKLIGLKNNSIGKSVKNLKAFLNHLIRMKKINAIDLSGFVSIQDEVDHIYLSTEEIGKIMNVDCKGDEDLERVRDFFVIGCFTGLRFSDISRLKPTNFKNGFLEIRQKKTSGKVIIPLRKQVLDVLEKYYYKAPEVDSFIFNKKIKDLGAQAKINEKVELTHRKGNTRESKLYNKYDLISSHTCRRSFCTNAYLDGIDVQLIMKISGHKTEKAFRRYLKISNLEAAMKLKAAWGI